MLRMQMAKLKAGSTAVLGTKIFRACCLCFIALMAIALVGCTNRSASCKAQIEMLEPIASRNPHGDVQRAIAAHDLRFIGVYGFSVDVPGMDEHKNVVKDHGLRMIDGTSDAPCDAQHSQLVREVTNYARSYNLELFEAIQAN